MASCLSFYDTGTHVVTKRWSFSKSFFVNCHQTGVSVEQRHLSCKLKCVVLILASNGTLPTIKKKNTSVIYLAIHVTEKKILYLLSMSAGEGLPETRVP